MTLMSIVTVTFNDPSGLERTLQSLDPILDDRRVQLIVVDGAMAENTLRLMSKRPQARLISEPDRGIYDAMNKGLRAAEGMYTWFLNGGDSSLLSEVTLQRLLKTLTTEPMSLYGASYDLRIGDRVIRRHARPALYTYHALPTSHQALFFPTELANQCGGYPARYQMSGDYYLFARLLKDGVPYRRLDIAAAAFYAGGHSTVHARRIATDALDIQRTVLQSPTIFRLASRALHWTSRSRRNFGDTP